MSAPLGTMSAPFFIPPAAVGTLGAGGAAGNPVPLSLPLPLLAATEALAAAAGAEDAEQQRDQCGALPGPPGALPGPPAAQLMPGVFLPDPPQVPPQVPGFRPPLMPQHHQNMPEGPGGLPATLPGLAGPLLRPPPQGLPLPQPGAALPEPAAAVDGTPCASLLLEALLREMPAAEPTAAAAAAAGGGAGGSSGASGGGQGDMQAPQQLLQADLAAVGQTGADLGPGEFSMQRQQQQQQQWRAQEDDPQLLKTAAPRRWMAKHAVLLSSLQVFTYGTDEGQLAQGVKAALGAAPAAAGDAAATTALLPADLPAAATASTAAADGAAADEYTAAAAAAAGGTLPLQEFTVHGPSNGSLLCALAGSRQLTKLDFNLISQATSSAAVQAALASLTSLRELSFKDWDPPRSRGPPLEWDDVKGHQARAEAPRAFEELVPQLQPLTHLTRLEYDAMPYRQVRSLRE